MNKKQILKIFLYLFMISFIVSLIWEIGHSFLYDWTKFPLKPDFDFYIFRILKSVFGDVLFIIIMFLINAFAHRNIEWFYNIKKKDIFILIISGLAFAILLEIRASIFNYWSYNKYMPIIFGIGLTPLMQLSITGVLSIFILKIFIGDKNIILK